MDLEKNYYAIAHIHSLLNEKDVHKYNIKQNMKIANSVISLLSFKVVKLASLDPRAKADYAEEFQHCNRIAFNLVL